MLKRSIKTLQFILEELDQLWIPVHKNWRLNERHYGDLQEVSKAETAKKFGEKQLQDWRRGYDSAPAHKTHPSLLTQSVKDFDATCTVVMPCRSDRMLNSVLCCLINAQMLSSVYASSANIHCHLFCSSRKRS